MANQNQEHLELRSEKVRHIIGNIPSSLVWISGIIIVLSTINGSLKFEITAKRLYAASQRVL